MAHGILVCKGAWLNGISVVYVSTDRVSLEGAWPNTWSHIMGVAYAGVALLSTRHTRVRGGA